MSETRFDVAAFVNRSLRWESDTRYYIAFVHQDLFGELVLSRYWGAKETRRGGERHERLTCLEDIAVRLQQILRGRERRGYRLVPAH